MSTRWPKGKLAYGGFSPSVKDTEATAAEIDGMASTPGVSVDPSDWPVPHAFVASADDATVCRCGLVEGDADDEKALSAHAVDMTAMFDDDEMAKLFDAMDSDEFEVADELLTKAEQRYWESKGAPSCSYCDKTATVKVTLPESDAHVNACATHKGMAVTSMRKKKKGEPDVTTIGGTKAASAAKACAYCDNDADYEVTADGDDKGVPACSTHLPLAKAAAKKKGKGKAPAVADVSKGDGTGTDATKVAGTEVTPEDAKNTERLRQYWTHGAGGAKIRWGQNGDFDRCVVQLTKYLKDPEKAKGYCNLRHHEATGMWPSQHAALVKKGEGKKDDDGPVTPWMRYAAKAAPASGGGATATGSQAGTASSSSSSSGGDFNSKHPRLHGRFAPKGSGSTSSGSGSGAGGSGNPFDAAVSSIEGQAHAAAAKKASAAAAAAQKRYLAAVAKAQKTQSAKDKAVARYLGAVAKQKATLAKQHATASAKATAAAKKAAAAPLALNGGQMSAVQNRLNALYPSAKIKVEGINNGATTHAIRVFQSQNGLPVTGVINKATYTALANPKAVHNDVGATTATASTAASTPSTAASAARAGTVLNTAPNGVQLASIQARAAAAGQGRIPAGKADDAPLSIEDGYPTEPVPEGKLDAGKKRKGSMPDGSYPVANANDLHNAIQAFGRGSPSAARKKKIKRHIKNRAAQIGRTDMLPDTWKGSGSKALEEVA